MSLYSSTALDPIDWAAIGLVVLLLGGFLLAFLLYFRIGMQNSLGSIAGVVVGPLTGLIVDHTGHFGWAFVLCAGVTFIGGISWTQLVGRLEQPRWQSVSQAAADGTSTNLAEVQ